MNIGLNHRLLKWKVGSLNQVREDKKVSFESFALQAYLFLLVRVNYSSRVGPIPELKIIQ